MKQSSNPEELWKPIELLRNALVIVPWWGNAYYDLSRGLELSGKYDDAVKQLNYYLELKPPGADARQARAQIAVIQAEKQATAGKKQQEESVLAVRYVAGGATRMRKDDAPKWWHNSGSIDTLYNYLAPEEWPLYINTFRFPNGHFLNISLIAQSNNGVYAGDRIGVYDITDSSCAEGNDFAFGAQDYTTALWRPLLRQCLRSAQCNRHGHLPGYGGFNHATGSPALSRPGAQGKWVLGLRYLW